MEERGFSSSPSAAADIWNDSRVTSSFSFKSGPLFLLLMPVSLDIFGTKELQFFPSFPLSNMSVLEHQNRALLFGDRNLSPECVSFGPVLPCEYLPILGHVNLWKVNSCKGILSSSMGFTRFTLLRISEESARTKYAISLSTQIFLCKFDLNKEVLGVGLEGRYSQAVRKNG